MATGVPTLPRAPHAPRRQRTRRHLGIDSVLAGVLSVVACAVSMRLTPALLHLPWGRGTRATGDAAYLYTQAATMIRSGWFTYDPDLGFPVGMDMAHVPLGESREWALLWLVTRFVDDPVAALNVFFVVGFFVVGFAGNLLFAATVRVRLMGVLLSVAAATLPWHYSRFHHALLADYSSIPVFLLLAHLMWRGWWSGSRARLAFALAGATYVGMSGVYYAFFALLILGPVLLVRIWRVRRPLAWAADALVVAIVPAVMALCLAVHASLAVTGVEGPSLSPRTAYMSFFYSGDPSSLLIPWPLRDSFVEGAAQVSALVGALVLLALAAVVVLPAMATRSSEGSTLPEAEQELRPWFRLLVWTLLWFLPGAGWLFATLVSPEIRSWGRLSMVIVYIALVIGGILARWAVRARPAWGRVLGLGATVILVAGIAIDHRPLVVPGTASSFDADARRYAAQVDATLPASCPILELPVMSFPEDWADPRMAAYDHLWIPLYSHGHRWSFGIVNGTEGARAVASRYSPDLPLQAVVQQARTDGYCAVHVDSLGTEEETGLLLRELLGPPAAEVGRWSLHVLDG